MFSPYFFKVPLRASWFSYSKFKHINPQWFNDKIWISSLIPPYPSEPFNRFIDVVIHNKRLTHNTNIAVTSKCPYNCPYCCSALRESKDLSTKEWIDSINQLKSLGTAILGITGGEPLLRKDLEEIIKTASPEIYTVLFTTGYKLNSARVRKLEDADLGCLAVGLEYADEKKQDEIKGKKGSFRYAENAIKLSNEIGIYTCIITICTKEKIKNGEIKKLYDLAKEWNICEIRLISPVATGRWLGKTNVILGEEEFQELKDFQIKYNKTRKPPIVTWISYLESPEILGCLTGYQYLFIDSAGNICPCDLTPLSFGNVTKEPIGKIWDRMAKSFPRPRDKCLMDKISPKIKSQKLPLSPDESKKMIPKLDEKDPLPNLSKYLKK